MDSLLYNKISTDSGITALTTNIFPVYPTYEVSLPVIVYSRDTTPESASGVFGDSGVKTYFYYIDVFAINQSTARSVGDAVIACLKAYRNLPTIMGCFFQDEQTVDSEIGYRLRQTYKIIG